MKTFGGIRFVFCVILSASMKRATTLILTTAFIASVLASTARADEQRMSQFQTALGSTTISGFVQSGLTFYPPQDAFGTRNRILWGRHQFEFPRFQNTESSSLTPLPPLSLDENTPFSSSSFVLTLVDTPVQPVVLPLTSDSSATGAVMLETIRMDEVTGALQASIAPPLDFQIQLYQAGIQPVPEPSLFAFSSLAVGLAALRRSKLKARL